jgi:hypothetical protein
VRAESGLGYLVIVREAVAVGILATLASRLGSQEDWLPECHRHVRLSSCPISGAVEVVAVQEWQTRTSASSAVESRVWASVIYLSSLLPRSSGPAAIVD